MTQSDIRTICIIIACLKLWFHLLEIISIDLKRLKTLAQNTMWIICRICFLWIITSPGQIIGGALYLSIDLLFWFYCWLFPHSEILEKIRAPPEHGPAFRPRESEEKRDPNLSELMKACWAEEPRNRPTANTLRSSMDNFNRFVILDYICWNMELPCKHQQWQLGDPRKRSHQMAARSDDQGHKYCREDAPWCCRCCFGTPTWTTCRR